MEHAGQGGRSNLIVFAALMTFAAASYALSFVPLGTMKVPVALAISVAKALLVAGFFMELFTQRSTIRFVLVSAVLLACTLTGLMAADILTRDTPPMLAPR